MHAQSLRHVLGPDAHDRAVADLCLGPRYSAVRLEGGGVGIALNFRARTGDRTGEVMAERWRGRRAADLLAGLGTPDMALSSLAVACANALARGNLEQASGGDVVDHLELRSTDRVGVVGHIKPLLSRLRGSVDEVFVLELIDRPCDGLLPACDVVLMSGATLVNDTLHELTRHCSRAREIALVGPTTTVCPRAFERSGVTCLAGADVIRERSTLRAVAEGAPLKHLLEKKTVRVPAPRGGRRTADLERTHACR
jgi:hypothetical protein